MRRSCGGRASRVGVAFEQLDAAIEALRPGDSVTEVQHSLDALIAEPCLDRIRESPRRGDTASARALATWWHAGGREWLEHEVGSTTGADRYVTLPPDVRTELAAEGNAEHPLARLLCPVRDAKCGAEAAPWWADAEARLTMDEDELNTSEEVNDRCAEETEAAEASNRYVAWRTCIERNRWTSRVLPLGRFRAPTKGWFVLRGRRGHYKFCDEIRVFDLRTGSAYIAQECAGLVLGELGLVDNARTDDARESRQLSGTLPRASLREAAWMTMMASVAETAQTTGVDVEAPESVAVPEPRTPIPLAKPDHSFGTISSQTTIRWTWFDDDGLIAEGSFVRDGGVATDDHTQYLWELAETGFTESCPRVRLPKDIVLGTSAPGVSLGDASPQSLRQAQGRLLAALRSKEKACRRK